MPRTNKSHSLPYALAIAAALMVLVCRVAPAHAEIVLGADIDYVLPLDSSAKFGGGFAVRLGQQIHLPAIALTPELAVAYASFSEVSGPDIYRGAVGARLAIGEIIRFGIFSHIGFGRFDLKTPSDDLSSTELSYDAGILVDFTLLPILNLGIHGAYDRLNGNDKRPAFEWITLGAHVDVVF